MHRDMSVCTWEPYFAHLAMKVYLVFSFFSLCFLWHSPQRVWSLAKSLPLPSLGYVIKPFVDFLFNDMQIYAERYHRTRTRRVRRDRATCCQDNPDAFTLYVSVCMLAISGESPQYNAKRSATVKRPKKKLYFQVPDNVGERRDKVPRVKAVDNSMHSCCCCCC